MGLNKKIEDNASIIIITSLVMLIVVILVSVVVFFAYLNTEDQVLVPSVEGSTLEDALVELQAKELYPRLQLRFSDDPLERGRVLSQSPTAGTVAKAGRRITLVVSRGTVIEKVDNYVGKNIKDVKSLFASIFTSNSKKLIIIKEPYMYKNDESPEGTILEQNPPAGTEISSTVEIEFVVSKGNYVEEVEVPNFVDMDLEHLYRVMASTPLLFNFVSGKALDVSFPRVAEQSIAQGEKLPPYSTIQLTLAFPQKQDNNLVFGVYYADLPRYPYPVTISCDVVNPDGSNSTIVELQHYGGSFQFPYYLAHGSIVTITALNEAVKVFEVVGEKQQKDDVGAEEVYE
ncbi:MAG: PASTA domain-containing protein [Treponema sp.]